MYKIIINDNEQNLQTSAGHYLYFLDAKEAVENMAINFVLKFEGNKYLKKIYWKKLDIRKGYALVKKENSYFCKITVYKKEPNTILYTGALTKVFSYFTAKIDAQPLEYCRENMDFDSKIEMDEVLAEFTKKYEPKDYCAADL